MSIKINLMGDVLAGKYLSTCIGDPICHLTSLWKGCLPILEEADLNLCNLETSFASPHLEKDQNKKWIFRVSGKRAIEALDAGLISYVALGNNHVLDYGPEGLKETLDALDQGGIQHSGAGFDSDQAMKPSILIKGGIKIAIYSFATPESHMSDVYQDGKDLWAALENRPGVNYLDPDNHDYALRKMIDFKIQEKIDYTLVYIHWGRNYPEDEKDYPWRPKDKYQNLAHQLVDHGLVDIIVGTSSHHIHGIERYKKALILYGTGDFLSDYSLDPEYYGIPKEFYSAEDSVINLGGVAFRSFIYQITLKKSFPTNGGNLDIASSWAARKKEDFSKEDYLKIQKFCLYPTQINGLEVSLSQDVQIKKHLQNMIDLSQRFGSKFQIRDNNLEFDLSEEISPN